MEHRACVRPYFATLISLSFGKCIAESAFFSTEEKKISLNLLIICPGISHLCLRISTLASYTIPQGVPGQDVQVLHFPCDQNRFQQDLSRIK